MGTSKKFVLASIISSVLVLAFMLGLAPSHDAPDASAADSGRISMVDLLAAAGFGGGDSKLVGVTVDSPLDGKVVKVNADNPPATLPIPVSADSSTDAVQFGAQEEGDDLFNPAGQEWSGTVTSDFIENAPFVGAIDVASFLTGVATTVTDIAIYAFGYNAVLKANLTYDEVNDPADRVRITLSEQLAILDTDENGIPFNPLNTIGPNEVWATTVTKNGQETTVLIASLDNAAKGASPVGVTVNPAPDIAVTAPSLNDLQGEGLVGIGETAHLFVEVAGNLASLLDNVDGDASNGALNAWAAQTLALQPGDLLALASYIDISIIYTLYTGTQWDELDVLTGGLGVDLALSNLSAPNGDLELHSFPTRYIDGITAKGGGTVGINDLELTNVPGPQVWSEVPNVNINNDELTVTLESLSTFAPMDIAAIRVDSINPTSTTVGVGVDATITGIFGNLAGLSVAAADAAYDVYLNATQIAFRLGLKGDDKSTYAIDPRTPGSTTTMYVTVPNSLPVGLYDVTVTSTADPSVTDTLADGFEVIGEYTLEVNYAGTGSGVVTAVETTKGADETFGPFGENAEVQLTAIPDLGSAFLGWSGDTGNLSSTVTNPTLWTALANDSIIATFDLLYNCFVLYVDFSAGGVASVISATNGNCDTNAYPEGTVATVQAVPDSGFIFSNWEGDVANPNAATTTVLIDEDPENVKAIFTPAGSPVILSVTPDEAWIFGGVVAQATGTDLTAGTNVILGGQLITAYNHAPDGTTLDFVVPPTLDGTNTPLVLADISVINGIGSTTIPNGFTYKRHQSDGTVNESAAILDTNGGTVQVTLGAPHSNFATIELPAVSVAKGDPPLYVIARNAQYDDTKGGNFGDLGTSNINYGTQIDGAYDFTIHLYQNQSSKGDPPVGSATLTDVTSDILDDFDRPIDADGNAQPSTPLLLSAPLTDTSLTNGDIRDSVTIWSVAVDYDYVAETINLSKGGPTGTYNSEIYAAEVSPAITAGSADGLSPDALDDARLYSLNGFSLRQNAILPPADAAGIRIKDEPGTVQGPTTGGTELTIISPKGDLAWLDRIEIVEAGTTKSNKFIFPLPGQTDDKLVLVTEPGTNEFELDVIMPPFRPEGIVDFVIYGKGSTTPIATLESVFEYQTSFDSGLLLTLLGLLVALIGLFAGGDSGGGGGGPCFIATAAYGTPLAGEIDTLRAVRDTYLLDSAIGSAFVDAYYHVSPVVADQVAASPVLAAVVRGILIPVIFIGNMALQTPALFAFVALSIGVLYMRRRKLRSQG